MPEASMAAGDALFRGKPPVVLAGTARAVEPEADLAAVISAWYRAARVRVAAEQSSRTTPRPASARQGSRPASAGLET